MQFISSRVGVLACLLIAFVALQAPVVSQAVAQGVVEPERKKKTRWHFGFTFGPEFTKVDMAFEDGRRPELDAVVGFHLGMAFGFEVGPFTLRTGLNFVNAGALFDGTTFLARDEFDVSFLTLPIDLRLAPFGGRHVRPYLFAGPGFRYGLDLKERPISLRNDIRLLDATFEAGVGISLRIPRVPIRFSPEIRYVSDLFGIYSGELETDDGGVISTAESVKANALRLGVLLGF